MALNLNWIDVRDFSFNCILVMERFQLNHLCRYALSRKKECFGIALKYNPAVAWYLSYRCPQHKAALEEAMAAAPQGLPPRRVRDCEVEILSDIEDFVLYTRPEWMDSHCNFIYAWDPKYLYELADFKGKVVLDVGSGSGRLAFAAAKEAKMVYASEPVTTLREFLMEKIEREKIPNVRVADGMAHCLPFPDNTFDVVMSGHVVGGDYENELAELTRVVKNDGWLLDCPGEEDRQTNPDLELRARGWEEFFYESKLGGTVYRYRKQIKKD